MERGRGRATYRGLPGGSASVPDRFPEGEEIPPGGTLTAPSAGRARGRRPGAVDGARPALRQQLAAHLLQPLLTPPAPPAPRAPPAAVGPATPRGGAGRSSDAEDSVERGGPAGGASGSAGSAPRAEPERSPGPGRRAWRPPSRAVTFGLGLAGTPSFWRCWSGRWAPPSAPAGRASAWPGLRPSPGPPRAGPLWWSCAWWWTTTGGSTRSAPSILWEPAFASRYTLISSDPPAWRVRIDERGWGVLDTAHLIPSPFGDVPALVRRPPHGGAGRQPRWGAPPVGRPLPARG